jgi:3-keto-L-gulonate-6-phosphate decarboxylase
LGRLLSKIASRLPVLQVAIDVTSIEDAVRVAKSLAGLSERIVFEVGTPLLKAEGLKAVRKLRELLGPTAPILADTKTVDVVGVEASMVAGAGADGFTVMAIVDDEVVREALATANRLELDAIFDTMYLDPLKAAERLHRLGVRVVGLHVGVDVQRRLGVTAEVLIDYVRRIKAEYDFVVAVAGGINRKIAPSLVSAGADIIVVGSAIVRSRNPRAAAAEILDVISSA